MYSRLIDHLFVDHNVQLAVFPEFISFLSGRKKIIRIVIDQTNKDFDISIFNHFGFHVLCSTLYCVDHGNAFGELKSSLIEIGSNRYTEVKMISIAKSLNHLKEFERAECNGDTEKAGKMLGYPKCCTENIENINQYKDRWALYYLQDFNLHLQANHNTNRFPISWGGISPIGELFPCSLVCKAAINYSLDMKSDLLTFGFDRIARESENHSKKNIFIHTESGEISLTSKSGYKEINFQ